MQEAEKKEQKKVEDLNAEIQRQTKMIAKKKQDMLELEEKEKTESKLFKKEFPHQRNRDSEVSDERGENKLIDFEDVDYDNNGAQIEEEHTGKKPGVFENDSEESDGKDQKKNGKGKKKGKCVIF